MLAFSTANDVVMPRMIADEHTVFNTMTSPGDHSMDTVYEADVGAIDEAIINALVEAKTVPLIKYTGDARWVTMDHGWLKAIMARCGRVTV